MKAREPRRKVLIKARMRSGGAWFEVCIRDISSRGLLAQTAAPPLRGSYIEIFKAKHVVVGRVIWTKDQRFGVHTQERMDIGALIEEIPPLISKQGSVTAATLDPERRLASRRLSAEDVARRLERSRRISSVGEFGCIVACGLIAAVITANTVQETLSLPLASISAALAR